MKTLKMMLCGAFLLGLAACGSSPASDGEKMAELTKEAIAAGLKGDQEKVEKLEKESEEIKARYEKYTDEQKKEYEEAFKKALKD